jgi:signal transduction histidine kinase/CheY-like chemotaxis protein
MTPSQPLKVLLVEDNEFDLELIVRQLKTSGLVHQRQAVDTLDAFDREFENFRPDIVLCDFSLPGFDAFAILDRVAKSAREVPVIIVTGTLSDEIAVECLKRGAADYLLKGKIVRLRSAIERTLELRTSKAERQDILNRLSESEGQLRTITNILPALLLYVSPELKLSFSNKTIESWLKIDRPNLVGLSISEVLGTEIHDRIAAERPRLLSGTPLTFETFLKSGGTEPKFVAVTVNPDFGRDGVVRGFVCLVTDLSERKAYEQELEAAKAAADTANHAKSLFLANMSHEMRTPLSAMMGFSELLLSKSESAVDRTSWLEKIHKNCTRLKNMIDEILDLSKIEAGKVQVEKTAFPIADLLAQAQSLLAPLAKEKNLELRFKVEGQIPEILNTDQTKLRHIFTNIIGNAIKFSSAGPVNVQMGLRDGRFLVVTVKDHGRGISPEEAKRLFQPFMQADNSMTRQFGGTGLGLALARRFAQALGGDVRLLKSERDVGSTFEITVEAGNLEGERMISEVPTVFQSSAKELDAKDQIALTGLKILLVEDSVENQFIVKRFLERAGAAVDVANNGEEGMTKAQAGDFDLVLMDIQMPVLDGYGATTRLRREGYSKPIVALTAHALKEERERCLRLGFSGFLTKPIKKSEILTEAAKYKPVVTT